MTQNEFDYYRDTSPEEFLADLRAVLANGDNMAPGELIEDVNWMTKQFMLEHQIGTTDGSSK